jgi:hypothetical protein
VPDRAFDQLAAAAAAAIAALSLVYAAAYLVVAPSAQRGADVDAFMRSYLAHPAGLRIASICLLLSGLASGPAFVALAARVREHAPRAAAYASIAGVTAGLVTAAHGLGDLIADDRLAHRYAAGDAATRAAVDVQRALPSAIDPRGLATFAASGLALLALGLALRGREGRLGTVGVVLGADLVLLFAATALGIHPLVLLTGGLASVLLGPVFWLAAARVLARPASRLAPA